MKSVVKDAKRCDEDVSDEEADGSKKAKSCMQEPGNGVISLRSNGVEIRLPR